MCQAAADRRGLASCRRLEYIVTLKTGTIFIYPLLLLSMYNRWRNISAIITIAVYLLAGVLLEITHRDTHNLLLKSHPLLASHTCGDHEIHTPLEGAGSCVACTQSTQKVSTEAVAPVALSPSVILLVSFPLHSSQPVPVDLLSSGKRGPPQSSL
jgi:hypothetical protein